jgi:hypothetical protein
LLGGKYLLVTLPQTLDQRFIGGDRDIQSPLRPWEDDENWTHAKEKEIKD